MTKSRTGSPILSGQEYQKKSVNFKIKAHSIRWDCIRSDLDLAIKMPADVRETLH